MSLKVLAFDLFGTVFDPKTVDRPDIERYIKCIRGEAWTDLENVAFPSFWDIKPFADAVEGLNTLKERYKIVAASNWYPSLVESVSRDACIAWDEIIDFRQVTSFKPKLVTYSLICDVMKVEPKEVLFVTGNKGAGDDTEPLKIGMDSVLIRHGYPDNIIELNSYLRK